MPNPFGAPEITVQEVQELISNETSITIIDVREMKEIDNVAIKYPFIESPLSDMTTLGVDGLPEELQALDKSTQLVVMCHHGMRSAKATNFLLSIGWNNAVSLAGGIDAWAKQIDPSIGTY